MVAGAALGLGYEYSSRVTWGSRGFTRGTGACFGVSEGVVRSISGIIRASRWTRSKVICHMVTRDDTVTCADAVTCDDSLDEMS